MSSDAAAIPAPMRNKSRRDVARFLLWLVSGTLLVDRTIVATCLSAGAVLVLKEGKLLSAKNLKWMVLSILSFLAGLASMIETRGYEEVDEDRAYWLKMRLWLLAHGTRTGWGGILLLFLLSASTSKTTEEVIETKKIQ
jgi:hypothetical protein